MKTKLSIIFILLCQIIYAQNNGYYITNDGEKHPCIIKGYFLNDKSEAFKYSTPNNPEEFSIFNISKIKEFGIKNKFKFKRFDVKVEFIDNSISNLENTLKTNLKNKTLYLKQIVEGEINIFSCTKKSRTVLFISKGENTPEQLYYKIFAVGKKDKSKAYGAVEHFCRYKHQLNYYANNDEFMYDRTKRLKYSQNNIVKLVTKYNRYKNQSRWSEKNLWPQWLYFNIETGLSKSKLYLENMNYANTNPYDLSLSLGIECSFKSLKNINLIANLTYRDMCFDYYFINKNIRYPLYVIYRGLDLNIGGRYYHKLSKKSKIFIEFTIQTMHAGTIEKTNNVFDSLQDYIEDSSQNKTYNKNVYGQLLLDNAIGVGIGYIFNNTYYCKIKYNYFNENLMLEQDRFSMQNIEFSLGIRL
ncbi:MAG: hypothetical protein N4A32_07820 [Marinifilaceae bacterium]|jgi:hypothetical protein|nr:hypothetical protein [Marinifilaceae bacterium]